MAKLQLAVQTSLFSAVSRVRRSLSLSVTVKPTKRGRYGDSLFVLSSEVVLFRRKLFFNNKYLCGKAFKIQHIIVRGLIANYSMNEPCISCCMGPYGTPFVTKFNLTSKCTTLRRKRPDLTSEFRPYVERRFDLTSKFRPYVATITVHVSSSRSTCCAKCGGRHGRRKYGGRA